MKNTFVCVLTIITFISFTCCKEKKKLEIKKTIIAGEVINMDENCPVTLRINLTDDLGDDKDRPTIKLRETAGKFHIERELALPMHFTIAYGSFISAYVEPGDSIYITIDASKRMSTEGVSYSGDKAEISRQINLWERIDLPWPRIPESADGDEYMRIIKENIKLRDDSLETYAKRHKMLPFVYNWAKINNSLSVANALMGYDGPNKTIYAKDPVFDIFNEENIVTMMYSYHVSFYLNGILSENQEIRDIAIKGNTLEAVKKIIPIIESDTEKGFVRDYIIFRQIAALQNYPEKSTILYDSLVADGQLFSNPVFAEKLKRLAYPPQHEEIPKTPLSGIVYLTQEGKTTAMPTKEIMNMLAEKYPGKVIYIDMYASWCGPCRMEIINHSPALHEEMKGKDVVFVNLCLASSAESWRRVIKEWNIEGENFWFDDTAGAIFRDEYKAHSYPTYMILDRDGKLVTNDALRPSDLENLKKNLEELL